MSDDAPTAAEGPRALTFREHAVAFGKELFVVVVGAIVVASLLRGFVGQMFVIPSSSMEDTLRIDDRVVVEKLSALHRGQVVVFEDPGGWLTNAVEPEPSAISKALEFVGVLPASGTKYLIKRVVGLPGDEVVCCDTTGHITVNQQPLDESSYLPTGGAGNQTAPSDITFDVVVPAGRIFVLGDNRGNSRDSRCHLNDDAQAGAVKGENAFVSTDLVVGRAIAVVWPFDHHRLLRLPATFDDLPVGVQPPVDPVITAGPEADC